LPKLFPRITFGHDCLGQALSAIAAVGFLDHFEDEFSHTHKSKLPMPEQQFPVRSTGSGPLELEIRRTIDAARLESRRKNRYCEMGLTKSREGACSFQIENDNQRAAEKHHASDLAALAVLERFCRRCLPEPEVFPLTFSPKINTPEKASRRAQVSRACSRERTSGKSNGVSS
jgi:hypothetical protein